VLSGESQPPPPPSAGFLLGLTLQPLRWRRFVPQKRRLTFTGLHGVISQKTELFITTAVRAGHSGRAVFALSNTGIVGSNPTGGMDVCLRLLCVCVVLCVGTGLATD
jgi:hypothetical protein